MRFKVIFGIICAAIVLITMCVFAAMGLPKPNCAFEESTYTVKSGDCLWLIANTYCPKSMSKQRYVDLIKERNNLSDSVIYPGQLLVVFIEKGD